uniref:Uncharacterized protein n=1 Tax=Picea glauca TaxID=3330 RepID=A0A117NHT1_PICGL|nr:hypothetical protein ABT39_MTgene4136 [Picea glauca]
MNAIIRVGYHTLPFSTLGKEIECQPMTLLLEAPDGWGWMVD